MARAISKARLRLVLLLSLLTGMVFLGVVPAHAAGTASISGTVTVPGGVDVTQTTVTLLVEVPDGYTMFDSETAPDATGAYTFSGKWPGRYKIVFSNPATTAVWNGGAPAEEAAPFIELADGQAVTGVDASLLTAGSISGTVTFADGAEPEPVLVSAFPEGSSEPSAGASTDPDGNYTLEGLAPGSYKLNFMGTSGQYPTVWNGNSLSQETAPAIVVAGGAAVTGEDVTFTVDAGGASISGTVARLGGGGVEGTPVQVFNLSGAPVSLANVSADGTYAVSGLAAGSYKVAVLPSPIGSDPVWYGGADEATATPVEVAAGSAVTGIDFTLPAAASLSGTVAGYDGEAPLMVRAYPAANPSPRFGPPLGFALVNPDGSYTVSGLPTGQVKVQLYGEIGGYANEWYGGTMATATTVDVTVGQTTPGIDFTAAPEAVITGQVKAPLDPQATAIRILDRAGHEVGDAYPEPDGGYEAFGLPAGSYKVEFRATVEGGPTTWYGGKTFASAATVTVVAGQTVTGIDSDVVKKPTPPRKPAAATQDPQVNPAANIIVAQAATDPVGTGLAAAGGSDPAANGELAQTGTPANLTPLGLAGGVLGAAGVVLLLVTRLRARRQAEANR